MSRTVLGLTLLMLSVSLAGCLNDESDDLQTGVEDTVSAIPSWVLGADGNLTDAALFNGTVPSFDLSVASERVSGEPTIGITRAGTVFFPAIDFDVEVPGIGALPSTRYLASEDGGQTWEDRSPQIGGVETHPMSFDPYVYVDPTTGRVFAMDMGPHIACNKVSWSDDEGLTWMTREGACIPGGNDHPSLWAGPATTLTNTAAYPNQLYLCTNAVTNIHCYQSPDGGINWIETTPPGLGYDVERVDTEELMDDPLNGALEGLCGALHGHGHTSWADGTVYLGRSNCGVPTVHVSHDGGLTWSDVVISDDPLHDQGGLGWAHDISISTDKEGNAYALWLGDRERSVFFSTSTDAGTSWSEPVNVTAPDVTAVKFASLVAGDEGRVAFLYVGTENPYGNDVGRLREGCVDRTKTYCYEDPDAYNNSTWNAYIGMSLDAHEGDPVFAITTANDPAEPLKRGACVDRCFGDEGGMYDFLDIDIDPTTGQLFVALADVCSGDCDGPDKGKFNAYEKSVGVVAVQLDGTFLLDAPIAER